MYSIACEDVIATMSTPGYTTTLVSITRMLAPKGYRKNLDHDVNLESTAGLKYKLRMRTPACPKDFKVHPDLATDCHADGRLSGGLTSS